MRTRTIMACLMALSIGLASGCGTSGGTNGGNAGNDETTNGGTANGGMPANNDSDGAAAPNNGNNNGTDGADNEGPPASPTEPTDAGAPSSQTPTAPTEPEAPPAQAPTAPNAPSTNPGSPASAQAALIAKQLKGMTLDEKIGEMFIAGLDGTKASAQAKDLITRLHVGGFIFYKENITTPAGVTAYTNQLKAWNKINPSPLFISSDEEGGRVTRLPGLPKLPAARAIGDTGDVAYASKIGGALGSASKLMGFNVDFAPVLDINSNPKNPVIGDRSFGVTSQRVTDMGLAVMKAIGGKGVVPVVKHFPGHGDTAVDSHLELPVVNKTLAQLQAFEWVPFKAAIKNGVGMVMVAHILFPKVDSSGPATLSKAIITDQLRGQLGFKGVVITDDMTMGAIAKHYGMTDAVVRSVKAGSDIILLGHGYENVKTAIAALKKAVQAGDIDESRIDESVTRILTLKLASKLSNAPVGGQPDLSVVNGIINQAVAAHAKG